MSDATGGVVGHSATEFLLGDFLVRDRLDDVGAGNEHIRGVASHEDEIGDGGRVDGATRARAHDGADLWDDSAGQRVAEENIGVARERRDAFLNTRAAGIVEADDRSSGAHGEVHNLADFLGVRFRERTAEDSKVLRENINQTAIDAAETGNKAVASGTLLLHAKIDAAMTDKFVELLEGALVQKKMNALARRELPGLVFTLAALRTAAGLGFLGKAAKLFHPVAVSGLGNQTGLGLRQRFLPRKRIPAVQKCARQDGWRARRFP